MKVFLCCFLVVASTTLSFAQDWNLINKSFQYNYIDRKDEVSTIFIDSVNKIGEDSIFYLNRIVKDCDTCTEYYGESPKYAYYNQPQFLNEHVIKTDTSFIFYFPNQFVIKHHAQEGESWIFDSDENISAEIIDESERTIFNKVDSIKKISLSTGNSIIISKNHGIIKFGSVYEDNNYELIGINNIEGDSIPDFKDIYDFEVGDIFEYHGDRWMTESETKYFIEKVEIKSKRKTNDTIEYDITVKYLEWYGPFEYNFHSSSEYNDVLKYVNKKDHPTNKFNNELITLESYLFDGYMDFCDYNYSLLKCYKDEKGQIIRTVGSFEHYDFFSVRDSSTYLLERFFGTCDEHVVKYAPTLGEVYHKVWGFEWNSFKELVGYVKGTDTIGVITPDYIILSKENQIKDYKINIYPNPIKDISLLELPGIDSKYWIHIFDIQGREVFNCISEKSVEINRNDFNQGIYFYKITNQENKTFTGKFIVK